METPAQHSFASRVLTRSRIRIFRRPIYIVWLFVLAAAFFAFTFGINRLYAQRQQQLSVYWFQQGQAALKQGKPKDAISDLRTALLYSHDNKDDLFALAQALDAANRIPEAQSYFLSLLEDEPGSGAINLELARLAARNADINRAMRYFNGAIYGAWDQDALTKRQQARQEFISFLILKDLKMQARGELLSFTADMPRTFDSQLWVAQAFRRLGDDSSALDFYKSALLINHGDPSALAGAGETSFHLGNYPQALQYYKRSAALHNDPRTAQMIQLTNLILDLNPFESNIPAAERRHRLILSLDTADRRLQQCAQAQNIALDTPGAGPLQSARSQWLQLDAQLRRARSDADLVQLLAPVAALIVTTEQQTGCGATLIIDQAMLHIYQNVEELRP